MISLRLSLETERYRVRGYCFKLNHFRESALYHGGYIFFDEYGEVEIYVMMKSEEVFLAVVIVVQSLKVASPELHEAQYGPHAYLFEQKEDLLAR